MKFIKDFEIIFRRLADAIEKTDWTQLKSKDFWIETIKVNKAYVIGYGVLIIALSIFAFDMGIYGLQKDAQFVERMNIVAKYANGEDMTEREWEIFWKHRENKMSKSCLSLYSGG